MKGQKKVKMEKHVNKPNKHGNNGSVNMFPFVSLSNGLYGGMLIGILDLCYFHSRCNVQERAKHACVALGNHTGQAGMVFLNLFLFYSLY